MNILSPKIESTNTTWPILLSDTLSRRGIIVYVEYQSVPSLELGPPNPPASEWVSPPWSNTRLRVRRWGDAIRTTGQKAWHSVYSVLSGTKALAEGKTSNILILNFSHCSADEVGECYKLLARCWIHDV
jgi:hypothetical protein